MSLSLSINGVQHEITCDPATPLAYVLRNALKLKGTKIGCGLEQCGACAVLVDGEVALSCSAAVEQFAGKEIVTIEGVGATEIGARVQDAFVAETAAQCGYCTSGLVVAATALITDGRGTDRAETVEALDQHLCRCGSHPRVLRAIERAAKAS